MVHAPNCKVYIGGKSLEELGIRHLLNKVVFDRQAGKFDTMAVEFGDGPELAKSGLGLITHGNSVGLACGYPGQMVNKGFGFINGIEVDCNDRMVTLDVAGADKQLSRTERSRSMAGKTVSQAVSDVLADYNNIEVGTIDNADMQISESSSQSEQTDSEYLEDLAEKFGMYIKMTPVEGTGKWALNMKDIVGEREEQSNEVDNKPIYVKNPGLEHQDRSKYKFLKDFTPKSSLNGIKPDVSVVSINPRHTTVTTLTEKGQWGNTLMVPGAPHPVGGEPLPDPETMEGGPQNYEDMANAYNAHANADKALQEAQNPLRRYVVQAQVGVAQQIVDMGGPAAEYLPVGAVAGAGKALDEDIAAAQEAEEAAEEAYGEEVEYRPPQYGPTEVISGYEVVFEANGQQFTVELEEAADSESVQQRINEAILNDSGANFVVAEKTVLEEFDPTLTLGETRHFIINDYPVWGDMFTGNYIVKAEHIEYERGNGLTQDIDVSRNDITVPPIPDPVATGAGGGGVKEGGYVSWRKPVAFLISRGEETPGESYRGDGVDIPFGGNIPVEYEDAAIIAEPHELNNAPSPYVTGPFGG